MSNFREEMVDPQIHWRRQHLINQDPGKQNARFYEHILPAPLWEMNLWPGINSESDRSLPQYLKSERVRRHNGSHNLLSSWILCANLYFPFRDVDGRKLIADFLKENVSQQIETVEKVELEYESNQTSLKTNVLLGEASGSRGASQTSPDVAFEVDTTSGPGLILVEVKFTEHSFYICSGRSKKSRALPSNPDRSRCLDAASIIEAHNNKCHLDSWERKYWDHLAPIADRSKVAELKSCPAAYGGYQLFRQQALAEAFANTGKFALVYSIVAYDERNQGLMTCMKRSTGIKDIREDWGSLFHGKAGFTTFAHQEWVNWVARNDEAGDMDDWLNYIRTRYGY